MGNCQNIGTRTLSNSITTLGILLMLNVAILLSRVSILYCWDECSGAKLSDINENVISLKKYEHIFTRYKLISDVYISEINPDIACNWQFRDIGWHDTKQWQFSPWVTRDTVPPFCCECKYDHYRGCFRGKPWQSRVFTVNFSVTDKFKMFEFNETLAIFGQHMVILKNFGEQTFAYLASLLATRKEFCNMDTWLDSSMKKCVK